MIAPMSIALLIPLILMILLVEDRKTKIYLSFFAWGSIAGIIGWYLDKAGQETFDMSLQEISIKFAPLAEEFAKALPPFVLLFVLPTFLKKKE